MRAHVFTPSRFAETARKGHARQSARHSCAMRRAEPMRCFYCAATGKPASEEHFPSQFPGSRLRRVCRDCNARAAREIDDRFVDYLMVKMPKALADVRSIKRQGKEPRSRPTRLSRPPVSGSACDLRHMVAKCGARAARRCTTSSRFATASTQISGCSCSGAPQSSSPTNGWMNHSHVPSATFSGTDRSTTQSGQPASPDGLASSNRRTQRAKHWATTDT